MSENVFTGVVVKSFSSDGEHSSFDAVSIFPMCIRRAVLVADQ